MVDNFKKYIFQLTFLLTACLIVGYAVFKIALSEYYFSLYPYTVVFFFLLGTVTIFSMLNAAKKEGRKYFSVFMIIKMMKLLSILVAVVLYAVLVGENTISFLVTFFAYYLIYSIFEAYVSMKLNKDENEISQK